MKLRYYKAYAWLMAHFAALDIELVLTLNPFFWRGIRIITLTSAEPGYDETFRRDIYFFGIAVKISYADAGILEHALRHRLAYQHNMPELHPTDCDKYER